MMTARNALIESARMEILHYGQDGARVDRIARLARVNKRMIYHHFGNKEGVYKAVLQRQLHLLGHELAPVPTILKLVCSGYLAEIGTDLLDEQKNPIDQSSLRIEDYKIAAIICVRALLSLAGNSSFKNSNTLKYISDLHLPDRAELFTGIMDLIFVSRIDSKPLLRADVVKSDIEFDDKKGNKTKRQILANSRPA